MGIFKAYDIRGVYGKELTEGLVYKIARAYVRFLDAKKVVIGHDCRLSSPKLSKALSKGLCDEGADTVDIGFASTDMLYFAVGKYGFDGGIMITASHNPKEYNGLKLTRKLAIPIGVDSGLLDIQVIVKNNSFEARPNGNKGRLTAKEVKKEFIKHILSFVDLKNIKPLKVVVDGSNGMAGLVIDDLFKTLPCKLIKINIEMDGSFPKHEPNPLVAENRNDIINAVKKSKADIGLAFDGDCDRCFFIDDNANFISGDFITAILAERFLKVGISSSDQPKILYDVRSSRAVKDTIEKNNGVAIPYKVGHAFMKQKMRELDAVFGGELAGHYYYKDNFNCDSGFITALLMLEIISTNGKLSKIVEQFKDYYVSGEINAVVNDKDSLLKKLGEIYHDGDISYIDGISVDYDDWRFNARKSNTEPLLRLNLEANSKELLEKKKREVLKLINE